MYVLIFIIFTLAWSRNDLPFATVWNELHKTESLELQQTIQWHL